MGETIAETRLEIGAQRAQLDATVADLRSALDLRARIAQNPLPVVGVAAAAAFLLLGGPRRVARLLRRSLRQEAAQAAYDELPDALQAWVEVLAGPAGRDRDDLVEALHDFRAAPMRHGKGRRALAKQMVEGPAGPWRAAWNAAEAGLVILSAALARRAVERFLTDERPDSPPPPTPAKEPTATASYAGRKPAG